MSQLRKSGKSQGVFSFPADRADKHRLLKNAGRHYLADVILVSVRGTWPCE